MSEPEILFPAPRTVNTVSIEDWAASGRATLQYILGTKEQRRALFLPGLRRDRIIVATIDGKAVGLASFSLDGIGPFSPTMADFVRQYGYLKGFAYRIIFQCTNLRGSRGCLYLYSFHTNPKMRRKGIGSKMLKWIITKGRDSGCKTVELHVALGNEAAIRLYRASGFKECNVIRPGPFARFFASPGWIRMVLSLDEPCSNS